MNTIPTILKLFFVGLISLASTSLSFSQTTLSAGDIAIIAMNCDGSDDFSFVLLRDVTTGTTINFTESGWLSGGGFRGGGSGSEGTVTWTATSDLTCGTEVHIDPGSFASPGSQSLSGSWGLSTSGDQILAYQGASGSPTFIYALNNEGAGVWQANATSSNNSAIPTGLTDGVNAVAVNEADNVRYDCSTTTPTGSILSAVSDNSNWSSDNTTAYTLPLNCGFTCGGCTATEPTSNASAYVFSSVGCNSMTISWTRPGGGSNDGCIVVVRAGSDVTTDPTDGSTYTADATFGSGTDIGTNEYVVYIGTGTSVTVTGLTNSTTYHFNIFEYNGAGACIDYRTSDEVTDNETTTACAVCPHLTSVLINSCDFGCSEGDNEIIFANSGDYSVSTAASNFTITYGSSAAPTDTYTDSWTTNAAALADMNAATGCSGTYVDGTTVGSIPANSPIMIVNNSICSSAFDWSGLCTGSTIYVFFSSDATWTSSGQFSNSPPASGRYFRSVIESCTIDYDYDNGLPSSDGAFAAWTSAGGSATYGDDDCSPTPTAFPVDLIDFTGEMDGSEVRLEWMTASENNSDLFKVFKSTNGIDYQYLDYVRAAGHSSTTLKYEMKDANPVEGMSYYKLFQYDFDGRMTTYSPITINNHSDGLTVDGWSQDEGGLVINIKGHMKHAPVQIKMYSTMGQIISNEAQTTTRGLRLNTPGMESGIYLIELTQGSARTTVKVRL